MCNVCIICVHVRRKLLLINCQLRRNYKFIGIRAFLVGMVLLQSSQHGLFFLNYRAICQNSLKHHLKSINGLKLTSLWHNRMHVWPRNGMNANN